LEAEQLWRKTLQECSAKGFSVFPLDQPFSEAALHRFAEEPSPAVVTFARLWDQTAPDAWQTLVQSAASVNPEVIADVTRPPLLEPVRLLLTRAEYAAIVWGHPDHWQSPLQWGYLLQIPPRRAGGETWHFLLHTPASREDIAAAEAALRLKLPPSYRRLLMLTNGLGIGITELTYIGGAGPARADWIPIELNQWLECAPYHEIAAMWRQFQGVYDYERIRDWEEGRNSFLSDETILVPFAQMSDAWCLDRTRQQADGEYPILFWDHETREASERYPDFLAWFAGEIEPYVFDER
jgi:SMI1 / KNR4 family (SUKH-1)